MKLMTNRNNSINVPEARDAMDRFKMEAASEVAVLIPYQAAYFDKICSITMYIMNDDPF